MSNSNPVGGLRWVKGEIDASLQRVRRSLEAFAEQQDGEAADLTDAVTALHEIRGVLIALELSGPARLVEEMEQHCETLESGDLANRGEASEALMLALIQLPDYLDRLEGGQVDAPLALLPAINDLRGSRGDRLLTEAELLVPTSVLADTEMPSPQVQKALARVAGKIRPHFHRYLLQWFKPETSREGMANLGRLFHQLQRYIGDGIFHELFLAAEAVVEAMLQGSIDSDAETKAVIGHLDRVIKPFAEGAEAWPDREAQALFTALMSLIARCESSTYLVNELRRIYGLQPDDQEDVSAGRGEPGPAAMAGLIAEVRKELLPVKDALDLYARGSDEDRFRLEELATLIQSLANTLVVTGREDLVDRLRSCAATVGALSEQESHASDSQLEAVAGEILSVEAALGALGGPRPQRPEGEAQALDGAILGSTLREAAKEVAKAKEAITALIGAPGDLRPLQEVPGLFHGVGAALRILDEGDAAELIEALVEHIRLRYLAAGRAPASRELELLAQCISAIELHMDGLGGGQSFGADLIGNARRALADLQELEPRRAGESSAQAPGEQAATEEPPSAGEAGAAAQGHEAGAAERPGIDPEFLEIFLEEAGEEEQAVREQFARWQKDLGDDTALSTLRRSFHTLKGSGRLVGADRVGELARAVEALLNRVIDGSLSPSGELVECVGEAVAQLPGLIAAEAEARELEVQPFVERVDRLASGERPTAEAALPESETAPAAKVIPWPTQAPSSGAPVGEEPAASAAAEEAGLAEAAELAALAEADQDLLDIFRGEAEEHLATLRTFLDRARGGEAAPDEPVVRALHTLTGSARMTGIDSVGAATSVLEHLFQGLVRKGAQPRPQALDLLARAVEAVEQRVQRIPGGGDEIAALLALAEEAQRHLIAAGTGEETGEVPQPPPAEERAAEEAEVVDRQTGAETLPESGETEAAVEREEEIAAAEPAEPVLETAQAAEAERAAPPEEAVSEAVPEVQRPAAPPTVTPPAEPPQPAAAAETAEDTLEELPEDAELLSLFLEDARDLLDKLDESMRELQLAPTSPEPIEEQKRLLHTLKGSARLSGLTAIGDLSHAFESLLIAIAQGHAQVSDDALELAQRTLDTLADQVDAVEQRRAVRRANALMQALSLALEQGLSAGAEEEPSVAVMMPAEPAEAAPTVAEQPAPERERPPQPRAVPSPAATGGEPAAQIRVRAEHLNRLVDNAGEVSIYRSRLSQTNGVLGFRLNDLEQTVNRLRDQLRHLEIETEAQIIHRFEREEDAGVAYREGFDPLELDRFSTIQQLSRSLAETVNDLVSLRGILTDLQGESETLLQQQGRIADDLQDGLLRTRMVPFAQIVPRLHRLVRQTAQQLGKKALLEVLGPEVELDRSIQERIVAPLEHLLRNAVAHGIESPDRRVAAGKDPAGVIRLSVSREGNDAVICVRDDGAGLDLAAVRARAVERGLIAEDATPSDDEVTQLILEPGFSTAREVTQIAGRGVGMDVVSAEIKQLSGALNLESRQGQGASFTIRLPLTLAIIEAMLVQVGDEIYAVPLATMEAAARISRSDLQENYAGTRKDFQYAGNDYRVVYLGTMLQTGGAPELGERSWLPVLLARAGDQRIAFHVDSLLDSERLVVKPLGPELSNIRWLTGGTILPDGRVAMILDLLGLIRSSLVQDYRPPTREEQEAQASRRCVMIVDDSLTVRRVTSRMLSRQDMDVITARDGVDALAQLEERIPDVILLDVEMPRMDGYELTRHIRRSDRLKKIPLIMITSRTGEKHRKYAAELGVDRYLGKPYQEAELLDEISAVLLESAP
jgi:chemosensory pili system protein ChpA (sensor histidine kinase/response regulator)